MNKEQIEARLTELRGLVEAEQDVAKLADYEKEVRSLTQQLGEIIGEERGAARAAARSAFNNPVNAKPEQGDDEEVRAAQEFLTKRTMTIDSVKTRSVLLSSGNLATPTGVDGNIRDRLNKISAIVNDVTVEDHKGEGEFKVPYVYTELTAGVATEGSALTGHTQSAFNYVVIKPTIIETLDYVSKYIPGQSPVAYRNKVEQLALKALLRKASDLIVNGVTVSAALVTYGMSNGVDHSSNNMFSTATLAAAIGAGTLRSIMLNYGTDDEIDGPATLYLTKAQLQLFGAVRGSNEKKAVYEIEYKEGSTTEGVIKDGGLACRFVINSHLPTGKMIYGIPSHYLLALFSDYNIEVDGSYKFAEGLDTIKGSCAIGGNIVVPGGFTLITQHSTGAGTTESPTVYD